MPRPFDPIIDEDMEHVSDPSEERECGICGGVLRRNGRAVYFQWLGELRISETWTCQNDRCRTSGNLLRRRSNGEIVRLSHVHTGDGFQYPLHEVVETRGDVTRLRSKEGA